MKTLRYEKGTFTIIPNREALRGMKAADQSVFLWLCSYANEDGVCFPSKSTIARDAGVSQRGVFNALEHLIAAGLLKKEGGKEDGSPNVYQILVQGGRQEVPRGSAPRAEGVGKRCLGGRQEVPANYNHRTITKNYKYAATAASASQASPSKPKKDPNEPLSKAEFVSACKSSPQRHIQIVGEWAEAEAPASFTRRGEWEAYIARHVRTARRLIAFSTDQIEQAYHQMLQDVVHEKDGKKRGFITKYTLETLEKYLIP